MKLYFSKNEQSEIIVKMSTSTVLENFSYVKMIKNLLDKNEFEETEFDGDFSDDERSRITNMLKDINASIIAEKDEENVG